MAKLHMTQVLEQSVCSSGFGLVATLCCAILHRLVSKVPLIRPLPVLAHTETATLIEMHHVS